MPLFDFYCADCGVESERLVRNGEQPICDACGATLGKLLSPLRVASGSKRKTGCNHGRHHNAIGNRVALAKVTGKKSSCC